MDKSQRSVLSQMKNAKSAQVIIVIPADTWTQIVSQSSERVALLISADAGSTLRLSKSITSNTGDGVALPPNAPLLKLSKTEYGNLVDGPIFAASDNITTVTIWETFDCPCQY